MLKKLQKTEYDESYFENVLYKAKPFSKRDYLRESLVREYKETGNLLEIGTAEGYLLKLLSENFNVMGIEYSEYAYEIAKKLVGDKVKHGDVVKYELESEKYDVIVAFNILEHIKDPEELLSKLNKSMKKSGIIIGSMPNNQYLLGSFLTFLGNILDKTHISTLKINEWRELFKKAGFQKVAEFGEAVIDRDKSWYLRNTFWPFYAQNYVFVYKKL